MVEFVIVEGHYRLNPAPFRQASNDPEATILGSGNHVVMNEAKAIRRGKIVGDRSVCNGREVVGGEAV
jgi:hypothetical protein